MKDFRDLKVWQRAHDTTLAIYRCTRDFPREETYGMVSQLRRCSSSIAANIAEGCGCSGNPEFARFLLMAMGSASELEYFLLLARDLHYLAPQKYQAIVNEVIEMRRMLNGLLSKVQAEKGSAFQRRAVVGAR
ncbi:MAG TPA: four helix bundle protein [Terriglobales bacterium]|nr:four helix bundle protein [Terriglobales bacterium]